MYEVADALDALDLLPWVAQVQEQIAPYVAADTKKPWTDDQVTDYQDLLVDMVTNRRSQLEGIISLPVE